ncbi:hypothetical protein M8J76_000372 [Diaphorina citri]|nr:hypothetical protein M8J76_000372 [Diaphorina citri]
MIQLQPKSMKMNSLITPSIPNQRNTTRSTPLLVSGTLTQSTMDGGFAGNSSGRQQKSDPKSKLSESQKQVDEVVGIMRVNVEKVLERDQKLSELDNRANALQQGASQFEQQAGKLKKKMWWKNMKWMIIMGTTAAVVLILIILWISDGSDSKPNP